MNKVVPDIDAAIADIEDGAMIAIPGFFACGVPRDLIDALIRKGTKDLTLTCGCGPLLGAANELTTMVKNGQLKKVIDSYGLFRSASKGMQDPFEQAVRAGEIEFEVYPMGTMAEKYRAGGAGIPAFYTPTGYGTVVAEGKEIRWFDDRPYLMEHAIKADYAFVRAYKADGTGNLVYRGTQRQFNPIMAMNASITIAEVDEVVEAGELDPEGIVTPGIFVNRIVKVKEDPGFPRHLETSFGVGRAK